MTELTVNVSKTVHAPIEAVFDAWQSAETLAKFIFPAPGMPAPKVTTEARKGGGFTILMQVGNEQIPHTGIYLEVSRPTKLVFTWESPSSLDGSTVTLNFSAVEEHKTVVELTQVKFLDEEARTNHEGGWSNILAKLAEVVG